eukprot:5974204-Prymnesium_polylepis.1
MLSMLVTTTGFAATTPYPFPQDCSNVNATTGAPGFFAPLDRGLRARGGRVQGLHQGFGRLLQDSRSQRAVLRNFRGFEPTTGLRNSAGLTIVPHCDQNIGNTTFGASKAG